MENYSVLMSVYKKEKPEYLKQSIESILNQTYQTNDFVIIEDGVLTDELEGILSQYKDNRCVHIYRLKHNVGLGRALNYGLKKCKNELVARMDSDDISLPDRCRKQVSEFEKDQKLKLVGTFIEEFIENPDEIIALKISPCTMQEIYRFAKRRNPFNHPTVMYKKSYILKHGGYSSLRKGQDFELFNRLISEGMECRNIPDYLLKFRRDRDANTRRKNKDSVITNIKIIRCSWKRGYSSLGDLLYTIITQMALILFPERLINVIYTQLYRIKK